MNIHQVDARIAELNEQDRAIGNKDKISAGDIIFISIAITLTIGFILFGAK